MKTLLLIILASVLLSGCMSNDEIDKKSDSDNYCRYLRSVENSQDGMEKAEYGPQIGNGGRTGLEQRVDQQCSNVP